MKLLLETFFLILIFAFIVFLVSTSPTKINERKDNFLNVPIDSINKLKENGRPKMVRQNAFDNDSNRFFFIKT
uniref:Uncharacterized protein n=1 Tax=Strongyloides stercoralis TaxID=6248 RepID=A0A0K0E9C2_STRER